jgi:hypothetical protein
MYMQMIQSYTQLTPLQILRYTLYNKTFGKKNAPLPNGVITTSEGLELLVVTSYKYLGVWLDGTLSFSQHISKLKAKVKSRLGLLYRNRSSSSQLPN